MRGRIVSRRDRSAGSRRRARSPRVRRAPRNCRPAERNFISTDSGPSVDTCDVYPGSGAIEVILTVRSSISTMTSPHGLREYLRCRRWGRRRYRRLGCGRRGRRRGRQLVGCRRHAGGSRHRRGFGGLWSFSAGLRSNVPCWRFDHHWRTRGRRGSWLVGRVGVGVRSVARIVTGGSVETRAPFSSSVGVVRTVEGLGADVVRASTPAPPPRSRKAAVAPTAARRRVRARRIVGRRSCST